MPGNQSENNNFAQFSATQLNHAWGFFIHWQCLHAKICMKSYPDSSKVQIYLLVPHTFKKREKPSSCLATYHTIFLLVFAMKAWWYLVVVNSNSKLFEYFKIPSKNQSYDVCCGSSPYLPVHKLTSEWSSIYSALASLIPAAVRLAQFTLIFLAVMTLLSYT